MIPCICINNSNCPIDYPYPSEWLEQSKEYYIIDVKYVVKSKALAYKILGKSDEKFFPYTFYKSDRFGLEPKYIEKLMDMIAGKQDLSHKEIDEVKEILELQEI